jgi:hypothetical protein
MSVTALSLRIAAAHFGESVLKFQEQNKDISLYRLECIFPNGKIEACNAYFTSTDLLKAAEEIVFTQTKLRVKLIPYNYTFYNIIHDVCVHDISMHLFNPIQKFALPYINELDCSVENDSGLKHLVRINIVGTLDQFKDIFASHDLLKNGNFPENISITPVSFQGMPIDDAYYIPQKWFKNKINE